MAGLAHFSHLRANLNRPSISLTPSAHRRSTIVASVAQKLSYQDSIHLDIDTHLKKAIPIREPISVFEPMHYLTFAPPKTTSSVLCVAACELVGGNREDAIVVGSAIHVMNAAIYVHEHLLLKGVKEPESRTPYRFGQRIELLTSDGMMPFGLELLAKSMDLASNNADKILRIIIEITRAMGAEGMVDCVTYKNCNGQSSRQLHGCGAACGAILGGGSEEEIGRLRKYGVYVGKIEGVLSEKDGNGGGKMELIEKWRALAIMELEYFDGKKIEQISSLMKAGSTLKYAYPYT
ncbi:heterodimeric geranylgeranyl pyrophosphate synthase small subunit 2, chloroplastic-like [Rutidosis leptorrhynchoides]|uniref:heterodimeric geranylgeranyl pyrophosphate synthase small subunit 2, chloroplastic-like n=1 Tax=Rutidosis leptorrhynchoides TaxID=125765 RepID=UPI003A9A2C2D